MEIPPSIYFGGAGCGVAFYVGVVHGMKEKWGDDFHEKTLLCGDSIGSIVAFQLAMGYTTRQIELVAINVFRKMRLEPHYLEGQNYWLNQYIDHVLAQHADLHTKLDGTFQCGTTDLWLAHHWHTKWDSNEDLANCLKGSTNIPLYCDHCNIVNNREVIDGAYGMYGEHFPHGNDTLFVGTNQIGAEINYDLSIKQMAFPDNSSDFKLLFDIGYETFTKWDGNKKDKVFLKTPNYVALILCILGKILQLFYKYVVEEIIPDNNNIFDKPAT